MARTDNSPSDEARRALADKIERQVTPYPIVALRHALPTSAYLTADEWADVLAALRADPAGAEAMGWRPIESAPREQQPIMLALDRGRFGDIRRAPAIAYWSDKAGDWRHWNGEDVSLGAAPTHWQPLPAPPLPESSPPGGGGQP